MGHPIPFRASLSTPLIKFSGGDAVTIRDAVEGTTILGGTGSGKTSGSANAYAQSFLRAGMGGLVLCAKPEEADRWRSLAKAAGRSRDLAFFHADRLAFNFLDYAQATVGSGGRDLNLVEVMSVIGEVARGQSRGQDGDNAFFRDAANQLLANAFPLLRIVHGSIRLRKLYEFINSAPASRQEAYSQGPDAWVYRSFCGDTLRRAHEMGANGDAEARRIAEQHGPYWTDEFPSLGDRTKGSVVTTLTSSVYPFLSGALNTMFCESTSVVPEMARQGLIIVMDMPPAEFGNSGLVAQHIFKLLFQKAMEREKVGDKTRPCFIFADECQFFINSHDPMHLSVCRSAKVANVFITQDLPTYFARMPSEHEALSLIGKFGTRIFHSSTDRTTCEYASETIGKIRHYTLSTGTTFGASTGGGDSIGLSEGSQSGQSGLQSSRQKTKSSYIDYDIPPNYFGNELRTGGPPNNYKVDAIIVKNGATFKSSKRNRIKAEFSQR